MEKPQFTSGKPEFAAGKQNEQMDLDFNGQNKEKPIDFSAYNSEQRMGLVASIREKQVGNIPLNSEETAFMEWSDKLKDKHGRWN